MNKINMGSPYYKIKMDFFVRFIMRLLLSTNKSNKYFFNLDQVEEFKILYTTN